MATAEELAHTLACPRTLDQLRDFSRRRLAFTGSPSAILPGALGLQSSDGPDVSGVVAGDFDDGANVYGSGSFLHHRAGSTLFVFYPEG
jgi:hypothetical protein